MSSNIDNMKQAMFEMFGIGSGTEVTIIPAEVEVKVGEEAIAPATQNGIVETGAVSLAAPTASIPMQRKTMSYIAAGTVFEGTIRCDGDVEIAGEVKGVVEAKGTVKLYASMEGNIAAGSLTLANCTLTGNATVSDTMSVSETAAVHGNVSAKELLCAGEINGDLDLSGNAALEHTAKIYGNISANSFAVEKGAKICGGLDIKSRD